jgi:hypothetical protein
VGVAASRQYPGYIGRDADIITAAAKTSMVSLPTIISLPGPDLAAWIIRARGLDGIARGVDDTRQAATGLAHGPDGLGGGGTAGDEGGGDEGNLAHVGLLPQGGAEHL